MVMAMACFAHTYLEDSDKPVLYNLRNQEIVLIQTKAVDPLPFSDHREEERVNKLHCVCILLEAQNDFPDS
jgi:hypothetical protein